MHRPIVPPEEFPATLLRAGVARQESMAGMPAPTIVMLHGQPDSSASFWALRQALHEHVPGARVLVPDRPGYGANPHRAADFAGNLAWLRGWLQANVDAPVWLVGHSWAGGLAVLAAAEAPELVHGVVLMSSIGPHCLLPIDHLLAAPVLGAWLSFTILELGKPAITRKAARLIIGRQADRDQPYARAVGWAMRYRPVWRSFLTEQRALVAQLGQLNTQLSRIRRPVLILSGSQDRLIPDSTAQELAGSIRDAHRLVLEGGHDLQLRQPDSVARAIATFVTGSNRQSS